MMPPLKQTLIEQLDLPRILVHLLRRNNIRTFGELEEVVNHGNLFEFPYIGEKRAAEIIQLVNQILAQKEPYSEITTQSNLTDSNVSKPEEPGTQAKSEIIDKLGSVEIDQLGLPRQVTFALVKAGIHTFGDLLPFPSEKLSQINRIGPKRITEIGIALDKALISPEKYIQHNHFERKKTSAGSAFSESILGPPKLKTWSEIIEPYFRTEKEVRIYVLISRFGLAQKTLEQIASELGITRERVRQVQLLALTRFNKFIRLPEASRFLNRLTYILNMYKDELSLKSFRTILKKKALLGKFSKPITTKLYNLDPFEVLICWLDILSDSRITLPPVGFPISIDDLREATNISIKNYRALQNVPQEKKRKLLRKIIFTGAVHYSDAKKILATTDAITPLVLQDLSLKEVRDGWFGPVSVAGKTNRNPLILAGNKILAVVDTIEFPCFYDGLRRFSSRFYDSIAPEDIVMYYIQVAGFEVNDRIVSSPNIDPGVLSATEKCFIDAIKANGNVASFIEIAEEFRLRGFSVAAVSATLARSPIVEKVDTAMYAIRGSNVSWVDIEGAKKRQRSLSPDARVSYGLDGIIRYRITLNSWAVYGGIIGTNTIKDLSGGWSLLESNGNCRQITMDELFITGLTNAICELRGNIGDRIELSFNTWNRTLTLSKVDHEDQ